MELKVETPGIRLDKYLAEHTAYTRSLLEKMLSDQFILVNNLLCKASYKVKAGDIITIKEGYIKETDLEPVSMPLKIVYEDPYLIIVDKPSGLVVHPGNGNHNNTLVNGLLAYTNLSDSETDRPGIVHRIDKDTSGLLVVAKNNQTEALLADMFKNHTIKREYLALINGVFPHDTATIDAPIGRDPKDRKRMTVTDQNSKKAITHLTVLKRYTDYTLVKLQLETGRTHQIRVHMKYIGYPIYNDPVYSHKTNGSFGQFLHSYAMDFIHPITKEHLHFTAPLPQEFQSFLDTLEEQNTCCNN